MAMTYDAQPGEVRQFVSVQIGLTGLFVWLLFWVFDGLDAPLPPLWHWIVLLGVVLAGIVMAERVWLSASALPANTANAEAEAVASYAAQTVRKMIICQVPILLGVLWTFVTSYAAWPLVISAVPGLAVLAFEIWPSARNLSQTQTVLDSSGAESKLMESFEQ